MVEETVPDYALYPVLLVVYQNVDKPVQVDAEMYVLEDVVIHVLGDVPALVQEDVVHHVQ